MSVEINIPLEIPDVEVVGVEVNEAGDYLITVESTKQGTLCIKCGRFIDKFHGCDNPIALQHLSILGRKVYIIIRPIRYKCPYCSDNTTTTQRLSWYQVRSSCTQAYAEHLLLQLVNSTVEDVSIKEDIGYETVMGVINRYIATETDWSEFQTLEVLGLDEIALKKGHKNFATIVTARIRGQIMVLGVLKGRTKEVVAEFLTGIPQQLRDSIHSVCCDMYDGYINAAREVLGKDVKIVIDRFHVAKGYRKGVDNLRKQELKRLNKELPEEDYKQFKGAMWALRKDKEKLSQQEQDVLTSLFSHSPLLKLAYGFRNELTSIFEKNLTKIKAMKKISNWKKRVKESRLTCFNNFLSTLDNRMEEITNYFENRLNSGFVEGLNNKIKVIKRRCYGILNVNHLFQRICLDLNGYARFA